MRVGVDIGGTKIRAALVRDARAIKTVERDTDAWKGRDAMLKNIVEVIEGVFAGDVDAIGVGMAGPVDKKRSVMLQSPHIPCLINFNIKDFLQERFKARVTVDNDARMFTLGVHEFEYKNIKNLVGLTLGTGVGGSVIINGKMEKNPRTTDEEVGHIAIERNGWKCDCGARGCIEAYASGSAIEARYRELSGRGLSAKEVAERAKKGDKIAAQVLEEAGIYLGKGLVKIAKKYRPDVIVIGGSVSKAEDVLCTAKREFERLMPNAKVKIEKTKLTHASLLGAARLAEMEGWTPIKNKKQLDF